VRVDSHKHFGPAVAIIGEWDPLTPTHLQLFQQLTRYAMKIGRLSVVIMLDPPPPSFIPDDPMEWPVYHDVHARKILIEHTKVDGTVVVKFEARDLDAPFADFFELILDAVQLDEILLGARQSLGRGRESSNTVVEELARRVQVKLTRLPPTSGDAVGRRVRQFLRMGRFKDAAETIGEAPLRARPAGRDLCLSWPAGNYVVEGRQSPFAATPTCQMEVWLSATARGYSNMEWPDPEIEWLAFVAGPYDK
jgi:FAD synthase